jgi:hypothetical protein
VIYDPIRAMQAAVKEKLLASDGGAKIELDVSIAPNAPWRPNVHQRKAIVGWQLHPVEPDTTTWSARIERAKQVVPKLKIGIAAPETVFKSEFLITCYELDAKIMVVKEKRDGYSGAELFASVPDFVCERQIKLDSQTARVLLDLALSRALKAKTNTEKGILLEVLVALLLSQVDNFEVAEIGISNRSQQMDVLVHSRAVGGVLASPIVLAEAKNWKTKKVTPDEYTSFLRKLESRHGRAKVGFLVTTGAFTAGVSLEARRDSRTESLVVCVDVKALPTIWAGPESITKKVERLIIEASVGR